MGLESAAYISDLIATNPLSSDPRSQGDDHLRLLKHVLKTTFPNITGAVTATQGELNSLVGMTGTILDALAQKADLNELAVYAALDQAQVFTKAQGFTPVNLGSVSGLIQIDLSQSNVIQLTVASAITRITFVNGVNGKPYLFRFSNAGGNAITLGSSWSAAAGAQPNIAQVGTHILEGWYISGSFVITQSTLNIGPL